MNGVPETSPITPPITAEVRITETERMTNGKVAFVGATFFKNWDSENTAPRGKTEGKAEDPDITRGDQVLENVRNLLDWGYNIVIIDGGSKQPFLDSLQAIAIDEEARSRLHVVGQSGESMSDAQRQGYEISAALNGVDVIMTTQPEKPFTYADMQAFTQPVLSGEADMVIPYRKSELKDYPTEQEFFETKGNKDMTEALQYLGLLPQLPVDENYLDIYNGTRIFKNDPQILAAHMVRFDGEMLDYYSRIPDDLKPFFNPDQWFAALYAPVAKLLIEGKKIVSVKTDYRHPLTQTTQEEGNPLFMRKRWQQYMAIVPYFYDYLLYLMHQKREQNLQQE